MPVSMEKLIQKSLRRKASQSGELGRLTTRDNCFSWAEQFIAYSPPADGSAEG